MAEKAICKIHLQNPICKNAVCKKPSAKSHLQKYDLQNLLQSNNAQTLTHAHKIPTIKIRLQKFVCFLKVNPL